MTDQVQSTTRRQIEAARSGSAVSEAELSGIQGNINYLLSAVCPIGSIMASLLTEAQFQGLTSAGWELANGGSCAGSDYALLTGFTTKPDMRGVFLRGKNNSRSGSTGNSHGEVALGTGSQDQMISHTHTVGASPGVGSHDAGSGNSRNSAASAVTLTTAAAGAGSETHPRNVTVNYFVRIN